jgi:hypothetical protein
LTQARDPERAVSQTGNARCVSGEARPTAGTLRITIYGNHMSDHLKTTVYLDRDAYGRLKALARARRCAPAQLVREAVAQYAARETPARKPRSIGAGTSGRRNLSERDEELLARMPRR